VHVVSTCAVLNFRTPYWYRGVLYSKTKEMASRYATSWFIPDLASCASLIQYLDLTVESEDGSLAGADGSKAARLTRLVRLAKLAKLLRLARLKRSITRLGDVFYEKFGGGLLQALGIVGSVVNLIFGFMLAMHLTSCIFYSIGADGWVADTYDTTTEETGIFDRYTRSMYMVAMGAMPDDTTPGEEIFSIVSILLMSFVFGAVAATLSSVLISISEPYAEFNAKMDALKTWMRSKHFDVASQQQIVSFYSARLSGATGSRVVDEGAILEAFQPAPIADELVALLYTKMIQAVPMFSCLEMEVIAKLCLRLQTLPALKGAPVTIQGNLGKCMYIVSKGRLQRWTSSSAEDIPIMARCTPYYEGVDPATSLSDETKREFWAEVYIPGGHLEEKKEMTATLTKCKTVEVQKQMDAEGVQHTDVTNAVDADPTGGKDILTHQVKMCVECAAGGSIEMENPPDNEMPDQPHLKHRALDRRPTMMTATVRHSSSGFYDTNIPVQKVRYFKDFDPTEGESPHTIKKDDKVHLIEVRRGTVLSYLSEGDYTGEGCFTDESGFYRHDANTTAMCDSDLCFLLKEDLTAVKEEFPEVEASIQTVLNDTAALEQPRRLFAAAAGADGQLDKDELQKLLVDELQFPPGKATEQEVKHMMQTIDKDGSGGIDELEFDAWFRQRLASQQSHFRKALEKRTLGEIVTWAATVRLVAIDYRLQRS